MPNKTAEDVGQHRQRQQVESSSEMLFHGQDTMIDQEARDMAARAIALIESHDRLCTERQDNIINLLEDVKDGMKDAMTKNSKDVAGLYNRFWGLALGVIGVLLTVSGVLTLMVFRH